mmetsp:Transcript_43437/g.134236  ORF Transcript_43437/g.134236 Transcript_43437/m.134236 type:complete len:212 (+) Transcript_43437:95-730(+)
MSCCSSFTSQYSAPVVLGSCPDCLLLEAIEITNQHGGFYCAGEKGDVFNKDILVSSTSEQAESWKTGWKGKTEQAINMCRRLFEPDQPIYVVAIQGGPACEWEREQLRSVFQPKKDNMQLVFHNDTNDYIRWLEHDMQFDQLEDLERYAKGECMILKTSNGSGCTQDPCKRESEAGMPRQQCKHCRKWFCGYHAVVNNNDRWFSFGGHVCQ